MLETGKLVWQGVGSGINVDSPKSKQKQIPAIVARGAGQLSACEKIKIFLTLILLSKNVRREQSSRRTLSYLKTKKSGKFPDFII